MAKKAVLIGCNYPGTRDELRGCANDVRRMHGCLTERYGFSSDDIAVLIDTDPSYAQPSGKNIRSAITKMVRSSEPGDVLFVHYSGHGTRLPAEGEADDTGHHECIVPCDMNLITDGDIRKMVKKVPRGCRITIVADSCHNGGLIEDAKEQIGDSTINPKAETQGHHHHHHRTRDTIHDGEENDYVKNRSLPLSSLIEILKQKSGKDDVDVGNLRLTLFDIFKEDTSPHVKKHIKVVFTKLQHRGDEVKNNMWVDCWGWLRCLAHEFLKHNLDENEGHANPPMETHKGNDGEVYGGSTKGGIVDGGILMSGCQSDQTSANANPSGNSDKAYSAFSNVIQSIIEETGGKVTNQELVLKAREKLKQ